MTKFKEWPDANVDVLVGGTPCQSFSVAGLRKGLDDPRGNLMLTYLAIAAKYRPKWVVWENVPGVLSSNGGLDFASFLRGLGECGYGFAYRVLDAQYFGVPQRRRRVFVVGCLGDWRSAAAVLFEQHSLQGHSAPRRKKGQSVAGTFTARANSGGWSSDVDLAASNYMQPVAVGSLCAQTGRSNSVQDAEQGHLLPMQPIPIDTMNHIGRKDSHSLGDFETGAPSYTLTKGHSHAVAQPTYALQGAGQTSKTANGSGINEEVSFTLSTVDVHGVAQPIPFDTTQITSAANYSNPKAGDLCHPLAAGAHAPSIALSMAVRRLTPVECERLQGFPDGYTDIQLKGKPTPDGPRYKALGNSMAVPVMRWIGQRIEAVDGIAR
jgi:DNA (cytosine-5)-methyltransferase 1